jgi:hypothetical protein
LINQEASTYSLEPTFSVKSFGQAGIHVLAISQFYKKQFLAGHFRFELQLSHRMTFNVHFSYEKTNSLEHNLNRFWEVETVEQSTMTTEQQACEEHFLTHTTQQ